ncbi:MAG: hypothetical protein SOZ32_00670 [Bacilli bacterium]|nr:hypothetical protein [Bacilli bacterium]
MTDPITPLVQAYHDGPVLTIRKCFAKIIIINFVSIKINVI